MRVLLLEDNPADARLLKEALSETGETGIQLIHVTRLADAVAHLEADEADLVLLDFSVPDSHGFETFVRARSCAGDVPIVVLSGMQDEDLAVRAVRSGAQDYLVKGQVDGNLLIRAMRYAVERQKSDVALRQSEQALRELANVQTVLAEIGRVISSSLQLEQVFDAFAERVGRLMPFDRIAVGLAEGNQGKFKYALARGVEVASDGPGDLVCLPGSMTARVVETKSTILFQPKDLGEVESNFPSAKKAFNAGLRSFLCAPLISNDVVIGLLLIQSAQPDAYSEQDETVAGSIASQIAGAVSSAQLHAARRKAEEATRQSEARFRDLFDAAPIGYHELNMEGRVARVNRTELSMLGFAANEMLGHEIWDFLNEDERAQARVDYQDRMAGRTAADRPFEGNFVHRDGTLIPVLAQSAFLRDTSGNIIGARTTIQDISERKRSEEEREGLILELQAALSRIKALSGLLPICSSCKNIRDDKGYWNQIETYIRDHSEVDFSHGICPVCAAQLYPELQGIGESGS